MTSCASAVRGGCAALIAAAIATASPAAAARPHDSVGWRSTAVPIVNFSSDDGTGYGLRLNLYEYDGDAVPYRRKYSAQVFATTGGKWVHRLLVDLPHLRPGERLEAELAYEKEEYANYHGGLPDARLELYSRNQKTFRQAMPQARATWTRSLTEPWRWRLEARISHASIEPNAGIGSVLRDLDPPGRSGGVFCTVKTALRRDRRDNYNDSQSGQLASLEVAYGFGRDGWPGGVRTGVEHRGFRRLAPGVVLAHWLRGDAVSGNQPFYEELSLGSSSTVRGLAAARDRGECRLVGNVELRAAGLPLWPRRQVHLGAVVFLDGGQIFTLEDGPTHDHWRRGQGLGLRLHWHSTIVRADYSRSGDRTGLYITFGQVF